MDDRKMVKQTIKAHPSRFGLGQITAEFSAEKYPDSPLLDTNVQLEISPFAITWEDRVKLMGALEEVIRKFQI